MGDTELGELPMQFRYGVQLVSDQFGHEPLESVFAHLPGCSLP